MGMGLDIPIGNVYEVIKERKKEASKNAKEKAEGCGLLDASVAEVEDVSEAMKDPCSLKGKGMGKEVA
ncbi:hypothetical protein AMTR_s00179p00033070 [Amborella trichopoda]|uniref:Uncharacterized protein n=1 Tax=Amborella trichopoda TaxID=13333 RepID=W1PRS7_AMBTC|nr:hypothetical protein AMTR_s00179p00033070 [Amborella trichopoda]